MAGKQKPAKGKEKAAFPVEVLESLEDQMNENTWDLETMHGDLERLLQASIDLAREACAGENKKCKRFIHLDIPRVFEVLLNTKGIRDCDATTQGYIYCCTKLLVKFCAVKLYQKCMDQDCMILLKLLALALNPCCEWHMHNQKEKPKMKKVLTITRSPNGKVTHGWLCDLVEELGEKGFTCLCNMFCKVLKENPTVAKVAAQIRPLANCIEFLNESCAKKYIKPIDDAVFLFLDTESRKESFNADISAILELFRRITCHVPCEHNILQLQLRLKQNLARAALRSPERWKSEMNIVESIERFAQRDMKGTMTKDVLTMLWKLAERHEILRGPAFTVQVKILELSCERQKDCMDTLMWLRNRITMLKKCRMRSTWFLSILKQFIDICNLYSHKEHSCMLKALMTDEDLAVVLTRVIESLREYMDNARTANDSADGCFPHPEQVQRRLCFIQVVLRESRWLLTHDDSLKMWESLVENPVLPSDQEAGLQCFSKLMEDRPCLHPDAICEIIKKFVEKQVIKPCTITDQGLCCFDSLFRGKYIDKALQSQYTSRTKKFLRIRRHYLIAVILTGQDSIARKAIIFMKDPNTSMTGYSIAALKLVSAQASKFNRPWLRDHIEQLLVSYDRDAALQETPSTATGAGESEATPPRGQMQGDEGKTQARRRLSFENEQTADVSAEQPRRQAAEKKMVFLTVCRPKDKPRLLEDLPEDQPYDKKSEESKWVMAHRIYRTGWDPDPVKELLDDAASKEFTRLTLTLVSPTDYQDMVVSSLKGKKQEIQKRVVKEFLVNFPMVHVAESGTYIAVYSGNGYRPLIGEEQVSLGKLKQHPMLNDVMGLSTIALQVFGCGEKNVTTKRNAIYVALLFLNGTPAYYVGKASKGIKERWYVASSSHCKEANDITCYLEKQPDGIEAVVQNQPCDLAIAVAVKQMAETKACGVALFAIDFCPDGKIKCCNPGHELCTADPQTIDHYEQHYMNAFKQFYPDSGTEGGAKMLCLNVIASSLHHESPDDCTSEVALSLLLHNLTV